MRGSFAVDVEIIERPQGRLRPVIGRAGEEQPGRIQVAAQMALGEKPRRHLRVYRVQRGSRNSPPGRLRCK